MNINTPQIQKIILHPFHLVDFSPWPLLSSLGALILTTGLVTWMHGFSLGFTLTLLGLVAILVIGFVWIRDITREATFHGDHTKSVQSGLKLGFLLFLASELMLFFAFFWAYFHMALAPTIEIGSVWPPVGITVFNPLEIPLLNTVLLISSGATVTWAHHALLCGKRKDTNIALILTVILGFIFTVLQAFEYFVAPFTIADSVFGSTFYSLTGLHGVHVIVGTIFLLVSLIRSLKHHFTKEHHLGLESAILYWHLVDIVWLFLYVVVYLWCWI